MFHVALTHKSIKITHKYLLSLPSPPFSYFWYPPENELPLWRLCEVALDGFSETYGDNIHLGWWIEIANNDKQDADEWFQDTGISYVHVFEKSNIANNIFL